MEQATYKTYALQRLYTAGQIGVARLCRVVHPIPVGPRQISIPISALRFGGVPFRRPVGSTLALSSSVPRPLWHTTELYRLTTEAVANELTPKPLVAPLVTPAAVIAPCGLFDSAS